MSANAAEVAQLPLEVVQLDDGYCHAWGYDRTGPRYFELNMRRICADLLNIRISIFSGEDESWSNLGLG